MRYHNRSLWPRGRGGLGNLFGLFLIVLIILASLIYAGYAWLLIPLALIGWILNKMEI